MALPLFDTIFPGCCGFKMMFLLKLVISGEYTMDIHDIGFQKSGMSLIEVLVAIAVLALVTVPLMNMFLGGRIITARAGHEVAALNEAQEIMETLKAFPFDRLGCIQGSTGSSQITLDGDVSGNSPVGSLICVTAGKGEGQIREITAFDNSSGIATVSPAWGERPDSSSSYVICNSGELGLGVVRSAASNTVQLDSLESNRDDYYNNYFVEIAGGTGEGQVRKIVDYDGATKTATVEPGWDILPVSGSSYYAVYRYSYSVEFASVNEYLKKVTVKVHYPEGGSYREVSLTTDKLRR